MNSTSAIMIVFVILQAGWLLITWFRRRGRRRRDVWIQARTPDDPISDREADAAAIDSLNVGIPIEPIHPAAPPPRQSFDIAYAPVARIEGGYQRFPQDRGNYNNLNQLVGTNWGIAAPVAERYFGRTVTEHDMRELTHDTAKKIFRRQFWDPHQFDRFPTQVLANLVFDGHVNHGAWGIKLLQRVLGVGEDGVVGPITLSALAAADPDEVYLGYLTARRKFYHAIVANRPSQQIFLRGWLRRLAHYQLEYTKSIA